MAEDKRIYLGHGRKHPKYDITNFSICVSEIPKEWIFEYKGKKYLKLVMGAKKTPDQYGKTHSVWLDTFKPDPEKKGQPRVESVQEVGEIPF